VYPKESEVLTLACLYKEELTEEGETLKKFVVLTTESEAHLAEIHHRMPVILNEET
jgi:putative SOS response-associated peptidase YedK